MTRLVKNMTFNQVHGHFMLLLSYVFSHYALLTSVGTVNEYQLVGATYGIVVTSAPGKHSCINCINQKTKMGILTFERSSLKKPVSKISCNFSVKPVGMSI